MKKPPFVNSEIYHIYNRGVEKRTVFLKDNDYLRFIHDLFEFNDANLVIPSNARFLLSHPSQVDYNHLSQLLEIESPKVGKRPRKLLVEILAFCLMPNHFHLLIRQLASGGIIKFMQKLGVGYTMYFNTKNKRVGPLFQGRFKAVLINEPQHFAYIPDYIHSNPLDLIMPDWRENGLKNPKKAIDFMENYRWSSFQDYIGKKNYPSVTQRKFLTKFFNGPQEYKKHIQEWLRDMRLDEIKKLIFE